jgi:shikimate dehydrogenase
MMRLYGLIGYPLIHSFSKRYFTEKFEKEGHSDCRFENFPLEDARDIKKIVRQHPQLLGLSVTIPHKETIVAYLDEADEFVKKVKACNSIKISKGKLIGYNTDITGFEKSLAPLLKPHHKNALILGTGGASKAVKYVLRKHNISVRYVSRKPSAKNLSFAQVTPEVIAAVQIIVNTTPLGTFPNIIEAPDIPYQALNSQHLLFDLVYNPEKTLFLKMGEEKGAAIKNGLDMLKFQAEESWKIWND